MTLLHPRLQRVLDMVRPTTPIPTILTSVEQPGPTRLREITSLGGFATQFSDFFKQVYADLNPQAAQNVTQHRIGDILWYDEPAYGSQFLPQPVPQSATLRSTNEEIKNRLQQRVERSGPPHEVHKTGSGSHLRSYFGMSGPLSVPHQSALFTITDQAQFVKADWLWRQGFEGRGVKVAVIDTGIQQDHPMLEGKVRNAISFVPEAPHVDNAGHGTHVASTIAGEPTEYHGKVERLRGRVLRGLAPRCELYSAKALTGEGSGLTSFVVQSLQWCLEQRVNIVNMSLGTLFGGAGETPDAQAVNELVRRGIHVVCAAGNAFSYGTIGSPGSASGSVTVGSCAFNTPYPGATSTFSSKGPLANGSIRPTLTAPGGNLGRKNSPMDETILGASSGFMSQEFSESYTLARGSSMATPVVAATFALLHGQGLPTDRLQLETLIRDSTISNRLGYKSNRSGWGVLDATRLWEVIRRPTLATAKTLTLLQDATPHPILGLFSVLASRLAPVQDGASSQVRLGLV